MSVTRNTKRDRRRTCEVLAGGPRADEVDPSKNWLGHKKGAAKVDDLLVDGARREQLKTARGAVDQHIRHLRLDHDLPVAELGGVYSFDRQALAAPAASAGGRSPAASRPIRSTDIAISVTRAASTAKADTNEARASAVRLSVASWTASSLFELEAVTPSPSALPFLNLCFKARSSSAKEQFVGSGIYGICFRNHLVYIGSFCGDNRPGVDIRGIRWLRHLETVTLRGCHVSFKRGALQRLLSRNDLPSYPIITTLAKAFTKADEHLFKDRGYVTSLNRMSFAVANGDLFQSMEGGGSLDELEFFYVRDTCAPETCDEHYKSWVKEVEARLIAELWPPCNDGSPSWLDGNQGQLKMISVETIVGRLSDKL